MLATHTLGSIEINADTERILFGSASAPMTGVGIFLGKDGAAYEFRCGNPAGHYIHWDGSTLYVGRDGSVYVNVDDLQAGVTRALEWLDSDGDLKGQISANTVVLYGGTQYSLGFYDAGGGLFYLAFSTGSPGGGGGTGDEPPQGDPDPI